MPSGVYLRWSGTYSLTNARIIIYADGTPVHDTGCVTSSTPGADVFIPGGTSLVRVFVDCPCSGDPGSAWVFNWECDFSP